MGLDMYLSGHVKVGPEHPAFEKASEIARSATVVDKDERGSHVYVGGWEFSLHPSYHDLVQAVGITPTEDSPWFYVTEKPDGSFVVEVALLYWRKANAIHQWFVENVQKGVDDCGTYPVHPEVLADLYGRIKAALSDRQESGAAEHLPTQGGFFFGSTDYDEWYWHDLEVTLKELDERMPDLVKVDSLSYHSSW